jgi:transposase
VGLFAIGRTPLYGWTHRYNAEDLVGLRDRPRPRTPPHLRTEDKAAFRARVIAGPPAGAGLAAYRGEDLRRLLRDEFNAAYSLSGIYALPHRLGLSNLVPRPQHPDGDADAQTAFKKYAAGQAGRSSARIRINRSSCRFRMKPALDSKGPIAAYRRPKAAPPGAGQTEYGFVYLFGAVYPVTGETNAWLMPTANTAAMNGRLRTLSAQLPAPIAMPFSSSIKAEAVWRHLRQRHLSNRVYPRSSESGRCRRGRMEPIHQPTCRRGPSPQPQLDQGRRKRQRSFEYFLGSV